MFNGKRKRLLRILTIYMDFVDCPHLSTSLSSILYDLFPKLKGQCHIGMFCTTFKSTACKCRWVWLGKSWGNVFSLIIEDMMQHFVGNIPQVKYWRTLLILGNLIWVSIWLKLLWCKWYTVYDEWGEVWRSTKRQNTWMEIGPSGGNVIVVVVNVK